MASSSSPGGPHPLRPYYQPPEDKPVFVASAQPSSSSSSQSAAHRNTTTTRPPPRTNRYTSQDDSDLAAAAQLGSISELAKAGILGLAMQYSSTCVAMPFEVGKLLLQVQWVPKDEVWSSFVTAMAAESSQAAARRRTARSQLARHENSSHAPDVDEDADLDDGEMAPEAQEWRRASRYDGDDDAQNTENEDEDGEDDDLSSPSDVEAYFRDASEASSRAQRTSRTKRPQRAPAVDSAGYLVRRNVRDGRESGSRPEFVMPVVVRGGVWEMMKAVARGKEGWAGLWKGTFTSFVYDLLATGVQPVVSSIVSTLIPGSLSILPLPYVPYPKRTLALLVSSHVITHILLSPLDLIRTRLIVQSTLPRHRKYIGPWDALKKVLAEEGGWRTIYTHPHLIVPAILDETVRPLLSLSTPLLLEHWLHIEPTTSPVSYALAELTLNTAGLLFSLPIETVRRRLQVQRRTAEGKRAALQQHRSRESKVNATQTTPISGGSKSSVFGGGIGGTASNTATARGLRTCVETRPKPYTGVVEAIYRIVTEETAYLTAHHHSHRHHHRSPTASGEPSSGGEDSAGRHRPHTHHRQHQRTETEESTALGRSEILAPQQPTYAYLGGVRSLYRGFTMAAGANLVVFLLTVVTGEKVQTGASVGGAAGRIGGSGGAGGWAEI